MGGTLDALHALQEIECKLAAIRGKADSKRRQVRVHQRARQKQDTLIEEQERSRQASQLEIDRIDLDLRTKEDSMAKHREALNKARTNKEYAAILTAINTEKADNTKMESRQLEVMAGIDAVRARAESLTDERARIDERIAAAEQALRDYELETADEVGKLQRECDAASKDVGAGILSTFRRIAEKHEGEAMAEIVMLNAKRDEYACGGCNMAVRLQQVIGCKERGDIVLCGSCGRILYIESVA